MVPKNSQSAQDAHGISVYNYDPQNDSQEVVRHRSNHFDNSERRLITARYGEIKPFLDFDAVPKDNHVFSSKHELRSYTLKSPLFSNIKMDKRYFLVPLSSIIPNVWREFFANPIKGDDVPDDVYCNAPFPFYYISRFLTKFVSAFDGTNPESWIIPSSQTDSFYFLRWFFLLMKITSPDSLISNLGCDVTNYFYRRMVTKYSTDRVVNINGNYIVNPVEFEDVSLDQYFERNNGLTGSFDYESGSDSVLENALNLSIYKVTAILKKDNSTSKQVSYLFPDPSNVRRFIDDVLNPSYDMEIQSFVLKYRGSASSNYVYLTRDWNKANSLVFLEALLPRNKWLYTPSTGSGSFEPVYGCPTFLGIATSGIEYSLVNGEYWYNPSPSSDSTYYIVDSLCIDYSYLVAYQQICAQFYTVDAIDNVFSSEKWMKNMYSLSYLARGSLNPMFFDYNGYRIEYDIFSRRSLHHCFNGARNIDTNINQNSYNFIYNLFMPQYSLAYGDYFLGSRLEPLAVGDVTIDVSGSSSSGYHVSALDTTRNLQLQRFLNKINRTGAQIQDYMRGIFGARPDYIEPQPLYLGGSSTMIGSYEVENTTSGTPNVTTEQQGYPVTLLRTQQDTKGFELDINGDNCVVLGLLSFDMMRIYKDTVNRQFFKNDRFDFFQPDLQNVGDQALYSREIGSSKYDFVQNVPTPALVEYNFGYHLRDTHYKQRYPIACGAFNRTDILPSWSNVVSIVNNRYYYLNDGLNSDLIRNHPADIDKFYQSLSGITDSSYFHFIICMDNNIQSNREMQYKPLIQG